MVRSIMAGSFGRCEYLSSCDVQEYFVPPLLLVVAISSLFPIDGEVERPINRPLLDPVLT